MRCERCDTDTQLTTIENKDGTQVTHICDTCIAIIMQGNTNFQIKTDIVCICGSMRFFDEMLVIAERLTYQNKIVLMPYVKKTRDTPVSVATRLDKLHLRKIDMCTELYVVNILGHIEESTQHEIEYAREKGIKITYMIQ